eukprot:240107-Hanusia_phi.AAC.2
MPHWYLVHLLDVDFATWHQLYGALEVQFVDDFTCCWEFAREARGNASCIVKSSDETQPKLPRSCKDSMHPSIMKLEGSLQTFAERLLSLKNEKNMTFANHWEESIAMINDVDGPRLRTFIETASDSDSGWEDDDEDDEDDDDEDDEVDDDNA